VLNRNWKHRFAGTDRPYFVTLMKYLIMDTEVMIRPPRTMMEVFKSLPEGTLVQLIENNLVMSPSPTDLHQRIVTKLTSKLEHFITQHDLGEVRVAPYDVYLDQENAYQPDLIFIANENLHKIQENGLHGAPDLVIEVLSPGTAKYDKGKKKNVYERCGVKEYWIVDPATKIVTGYTFQENQFVEIESLAGVINSRLLDTTLNF
jgi:Uma2 family endonuclease